MKPVFTLIVDMKTCNGYVPYCRFFLGNQSADAMRIFAILEGISPKTTSEPYALKMELVLAENNRETLMGTRYCTLSELTRNCQIITKEVFKLIALGNPQDMPL